MPLVWAHAEYLKLLRSALDGKVFDRIDPVYDRYCEPEGRRKLRRRLEIFTLRRPIQRALCAGETLRIIDEQSLCGDMVDRPLEDHEHGTEPRHGKCRVLRGYFHCRDMPRAVNYHGLFSGPREIVGWATT